MRQDSFAFRNKVRAALVVETEDANGEIKRMIYGFDPSRELTVSMERHFDMYYHIFDDGPYLRDYSTRLTIEGWAGDPSTYSGPMPKADDEIEEIKQITDGNDEIIIEEDDLGEWDG